MLRKRRDLLIVCVFFVLFCAGMVVAYQGVPHPFFGDEFMAVTLHMSVDKNIDREYTLDVAGDSIKVEVRSKARCIRIRELILKAIKEGGEE